MSPMQPGTLLGLAAVGASGLVVSSMFGSKVVFYANQGEGVAEFRRAGAWAGQALRTSAVHPIGTAADFLSTIRSYPRIARFVWVGHGTTTSLFVGGGLRVRGGDIDVLAEELAPRLALGAIVGLAACSAAADPGQSGWNAETYSDGGAQSLAGTLRDGIFRRAPWLLLGEVRGHTAAGNTIANPAGRYFPLREPGRPGHGIDLRSSDPERWIVGAA